MSISYHTAVLSPQTISNQNPADTKTTLNNNYTLGKTELQGKSDGHDDAFSTLFGQGLLTEPTVSYSGASLAITFGTFKVLIGTEIVYAGGVFTALANQSGASVFFCQDGTWATSTPGSKSYAVVGAYSSNGTGVTAFSLSSGLLIPILASVTDTVENIVVSEVAGYVDYYVDHSAIKKFCIPGFITMNVVPVSDFYVELLYNGLVHTDSDTLNDPAHNMTEGGFWVRITRKSGYYYSGNPDCSLTYTRTGLARPTD